MKLTINDLNHLTNLAKIELSDKEKKLYLKQLGEILHFVEKLKEVKIKIAKTKVKKNIYHLREDKVVVANDIKEIINQFSDRKDNLLKTMPTFNRK